MRPVTRGTSPRSSDFANYRDAFPELASRLGMFCSFCERRVSTNLAVEHIQPKSLRPDLEGRWENFLLACVNCNSTKGDQNVVLTAVLLPDRDNTAAACAYREDGAIEVRATLTAAQQTQAATTLSLTGLNKPIRHTRDSLGQLVAVDRVSQRMEAWLTAAESRKELLGSPVTGAPALQRQIARTAQATGFFSVWMAVFHDDSVMRRLLIDEFRGTAPDCFDAGTNPVTPRPSNGLTAAGKV